MNVESFFAHHQIGDNPFAAEEARLDPVIERLMGEGPLHPDFDKVLGNLEKPSTAVVFGEKGSGKTAIRLTLARRVARHNEDQPAGDPHHAPGRRVLLVSYDELNPFLDNLMRARGQAGNDPDKALARIRLADHQDAILSLAATRVVDALLDEAFDDDTLPAMPADLGRKLKAMPRAARGDLAVIAALYDRPRTGLGSDRFARLRSALRLGWGVPVNLARDAGGVLLLVSLLFAGLGWAWDGTPWWAAVGCVASALLGLGALGWWVSRAFELWKLTRSAAADMPAIGRSATELRAAFRHVPASDLARHALPAKGSGDEVASDARYTLTRHLLDALAPLGYAGLIVLVDRVDEPTAVQGRADRMKPLVWPMFDNKFLKQDRVGLKLLLPLELRHELMRESPAFFQTARLDKQSLIDRLSWSGATLYDLCSRRLAACRADGAGPMVLTDLFEDDVTREMLVDALDQMQQPRDAFKLMYAVVQEHCRLSTEDEGRFHIARLTLESVRRAQSQRVQELQRGLSPA